jgi:1-acyl-sn-glycerol-3-phosphate acyltransferase
VLWLRSLAFNAVFYALLVGYMIAALPVFLLPRRLGFGVIRAWARSSLWACRAIAGMHAEFRGLDRIPPGGLLVAAKHQSLWETFALLTVLDDPAYVLKRELLWIPVFGWYARKFRMIPVERGGGAPALRKLLAHAQAEIAKGRQIIIFPEGTRRPPGAPPAYRQGITRLYAQLGVPCLPVALNSGVYWPRRRFLRRPGTIVVEFLEPIPPGLDGAEFVKILQARIEGASRALLTKPSRGNSANSSRNPGLDGASRDDMPQDRCHLGG